MPSSHHSVRLICVLFIGQIATHSVESAEPVDYTQNIKPIFAKHCNNCHRAKKLESGFRTDAGKHAVQGGDRGAAIIPGKSEQSLLYQALIGKGDVSRMPFELPALSKNEISLIKRWIDEGAGFPVDEVVDETAATADHWSFKPIRRPQIPEVRNQHWARNSLDAFVLARLEREGLGPAPPASRASLIRRLSLDLLGVTPSVADTQTFLADDRPGAYERLVDQFLASPRYGERSGRYWLDVARYADSDGYTIDGPRSIWKYRDWVVDALNDDLPFDRFTIEQLAGDLLPNATIGQRVATGFHRNTLVNQEGGTDDEQFRVEAIVDRVNTTGAAWLGLTIGCSQCHEHKFDPISQRDFYRMFAVFNNCEDNNDANSSGPILSVPDPEQAELKERLEADIAAAEKPLRLHDAELLRSLPNWEQEIAGSSAAARGESLASSDRSERASDSNEQPPSGAAEGGSGRPARTTWIQLDPAEWKTEKGAVLTKLKDKSLFVDFSVPANDTYTVVVDAPLPNITAVRIEALTHPGLPMNGPGRATNGNFILSEFTLRAAALGSGGSGSAVQEPIRLVKAVADHSQEGYPIANAIDGKQNTGWGIGTKTGSLNVNREAIFFPTAAIRNTGGSRLTLALHQSHSKANYLLGCFRISVSDAAEDILSVPTSIRAIAATPAEKRTKPQQAQLENAYKQTDRRRQPLAKKVASLKKRLEQLTSRIPTTLVLSERLKDPRQTHIFIRGDFLRKGAEVQPGVPDVLPQLSSDIEKPNRLDFAQWLMAPSNPLTARVTVNRFWQRFFGMGLVATENDFGSQGARPTHPDLMDWLSSEFLHKKWSIKSIHRLIVLSATYRQSSRLRGDLLRRDPRNALLARQSRIRLEAETIRDVCLSASGLLSDKIGGPSVHPPQPAGIYVLTQQKKAWPEANGDDRFRRGMYTYFWRSSPYPFLMTFDAPTATTTCTRRSRSNTPLQALTMANDRAFVEFAQGLASRIMREAPSYDEGRIRFAFQACLSREPADLELERLATFVTKQREFYNSDSVQAEAIAASDRPKDIALADAAAWTALARVVLNLDEFITRE